MKPLQGKRHHLACRKNETHCSGNGVGVFSEADTPPALPYAGSALSGQSNGKKRKRLWKAQGRRNFVRRFVMNTYLNYPYDQQLSPKKLTGEKSMEMSFFDSVLPSFRAVGVSKRRTQAGTLVLRLMRRCAGLKRPCTGPCIEGRAKKDISMLFIAFLSCITLKRSVGVMC